MEPSLAHSNDRRQDSRKSVDLLINRFLNGYPYMCRATDISRSGMRIVPLLEPTAGSKFMGLQFQLPGFDDVITASGEAVAIDGEHGVGIRFTKLTPTSAALIDQFVVSSAVD